MKPKHKQIALVSASALTAGLANGAIVYTYVNNVQSSGSGGLPTLYIDLNQDGQQDFSCNFNNSNANKPFVSDSIGIAEPSYTPFVLSDAADGSNSQGLPVTTYGTLIDSSYESLQANGYFYEDGSANVVGGWHSGGTNIDGYVGLVLQDTGGNFYYGWAHFTYNDSTSYLGVPGTLTLVDYAMETQPNTGILAGQTAEPGTAPAIVIAPSSQTGGVQESVQLKVVGMGNPAPAYQWKAGAIGSGIYTNLTDGGSIAGSTSNVLTINNLSSANAGDYVVVLSNSVSTLASSPATLTVAPLVINSLTPSSASLLAGGKVSLNVNYSSSAPVSSFQWLKNGATLSNGGHIAGATSSNLVISTASPSDSANYSVVLGNTYGMVTSAVDSVTVQTTSVPYEEAVTALNPAAYYRFNELTDPASTNAVAFDSFGGLNGTYGYETQNGNPTNNNILGPDPALSFNGFASTNTALSITNTLHTYAASVTTAPLNLNTNAVTFTAWVYPAAGQQPWASLISYRSPVSGSASGINYTGNAYFNTLGYHWNDSGNTYNYDSGLNIPAGQWSLVAVAVSYTNAAFYVLNTGGISFTNQSPYLDANTNLVDVTNTVAALNTPGHIGGDANDPNFMGNIDEVAIFNQTLTYQQITNLYNVAVTGQYTPPPANVVLSLQKSGGNLVLTWTPAVGTLLQAPSVTGPWTTNSAASPYTITPTQSQLFYRVVQ